MSNLDILSRAPLSWVHPRIQYLRTFSKGVAKWSDETCGHFRASWLARSTDLRGRSPLLSPGRFDRSTALLLRRSRWNSRISFPRVKNGSKIIGGTAPHPARYVLGSLSPCALVSYLCDNEGLGEISSLLSDGISFIAVFTHVML